MGCSCSTGQNQAPSRCDQEPAETFDEDVAWHIAAHQLTGDPGELIKLESILDDKAQTQDLRYVVGDRVYAINPSDPSFRMMKGIITSIITTGLEPLYYVRFRDGRSAMVPASEVSAESCRTVRPSGGREVITFDDKVRYIGPDFLVDVSEERISTDIFPKNFWKQNDPDDGRDGLSAPMIERILSNSVPLGMQQTPSQYNRGQELDGESPRAEELVRPPSRSGRKRRQVAALMGRVGVRAQAAVPFLPPSCKTVETNSLGTVCGFAMVDRGHKLQLHICVAFEGTSGVHRINPEYIKKATGKELEEKGVLDQVEVDDHDVAEAELRHAKSNGSQQQSNGAVSREVEIVFDDGAETELRHAKSNGSQQQCNRAFSREGCFSRAPATSRPSFCESIPECSSEDSCFLDVAGAHIRAMSTNDDIQQRMGLEEDKNRSELPPALRQIAEPTFSKRDWSSVIQKIGGENVGLDPDVFDMLYQENNVAFSKWWQ